MRLPRWTLIALGYVVPLALVAIGAAFWGNHIEHRIDRVVIDRHRDHKTLRGVVAALGDAREVAAGADAEESGGRAETRSLGESHTTTTAPAPVGGGVGKGKGAKPPAKGGGKPDQGDETQPSPPPATGSPAGTGTSSEPASEADQEDRQETEQVKPGLLGNPGGTVGEVTCGLNQLTEVAGVRVCSE